MPTGDVSTSVEEVPRLEWRKQQGGVPEVFEAGVLLAQEDQKLATEDELQLLGGHFHGAFGQ